MAEAGAREGVPAALLAETALALAILMSCPMRFANLTGLRLDRHIRRERAGRRDRVYIVLEAHEVKNRRRMEFELPVHVVALLDRHFAATRSLLARTGSAWLFPMRTADRPIAQPVLRRRLSRAVRDRLGLEFHPHLARHVAALIYLTAHPGDFETVRRLLRHARGSAAIDHYAAFEAEAAHRSFTALLDELSLAP